MTVKKRHGSGEKQRPRSVRGSSPAVRRCDHRDTELEDRCVSRERRRDVSIGVHRNPRGLRSLLLLKGSLAGITVPTDSVTYTVKFHQESGGTGARMVDVRRGPSSIPMASDAIVQLLQAGIRARSSSPILGLAECRGDGTDGTAGAAAAPDRPAGRAFRRESTRGGRARGFAARGRGHACEGGRGLTGSTECDARRKFCYDQDGVELLECARGPCDGICRSLGRNQTGRGRYGAANSPCASKPKCRHEAEDQCCDIGPDSGRIGCVKCRLLSLAWPGGL